MKYNPVIKYGRTGWLVAVEYAATLPMTYYHREIMDNQSGSLNILRLLYKS